MLATPHIPPALPPHPRPDHHNNPNDPFHALYSSLANLTLTTREKTAASDPDSASTSSSPATIPQSSHPQPPVIEVTPLFQSGRNVVFAHSSFFRRRTHGLPTPSWQPDLPTPAQVRERSARLGLLSNCNHGEANAEQEVLVPFPEFPTRLMVKYHRVPPGNGNGNVNVNVNGSHAASSEGKAMMLVRSVITGSEAVVPEIFGWRQDADTGEGFLYMAMPEGDVLANRWEGMTEMERGDVCTQLKGVVSEWRRLRLGGVGFVGSVDNGPLGDLVFQGCTTAGAPPPGPFPRVAAFHEYFVTMAVSISQSRYAGAEAGQIRYTPHHLFPDDVPVLFTHGALHPRNIIISAGPSPRLVSIIGWEQAGWYPVYWELCKARLECSRHGGLGSWETKYLPWILDAEGLSRDTRGWQVGSLCQYWDYFVGLM